MNRIKEQIDKEMEDVCFDTEAFMAHWKENRGGWEKHRRIRKRQIAAAVLAVSACCMGMGTYAAVNHFQQRGLQLTQREKDAYVEDIANAPVHADAYSRELTDEEKERRNVLMEKYLQEGLYPKEKLLKISSEEEVVEGRVCFLPETSTYYLPERELSDEDLLEIIDYGFMVDYSLAQQEGAEELEKGQQEEQEQNLARLDMGEISMDEAIAIAKEMVSRVFGEEMDGWEVKAEKDTYKLEGEDAACSDGNIYFTKEDEKTQYSVVVDLVTEEVRVLDSFMDGEGDYKGKIESGDAVEKDLVQSIKEKACLFMGEQASVRNGYVQVITDQEGYSEHGVIHYFFEIDNNEVLKVDYNFASQRMFGFWKISKESFLSQKDMFKKQSARENMIYQWIDINENH